MDMMWSCWKFGRLDRGMFLQLLEHITWFHHESEKNMSCCSSSCSFSQHLDKEVPPSVQGI